MGEHLQARKSTVKKAELQRGKIWMQHQGCERKLVLWMGNISTSGAQRTVTNYHKLVSSLERLLW